MVRIDRREFVSRTASLATAAAAARSLMGRTTARGIASEVSSQSSDIYTTLRTRELTAVVGNNESGGDHFPLHRRKYNGLWSLSSVHDPNNCFVPSYAGMNLEHFMDDLFMTPAGGEKFEPRNVRMKLERLDESTACLSHSASPLTGVSSRTTFRVREPHSIDFEFEATWHRPPRAGSWTGVFWASYINAPESPAMHFQDADGRWATLAADTHGRGGGNTVCHESVVDPVIGNPELVAAHSLAHSYSHRRFSIPLMYGRPGDGHMMLLYLFDQTSPVRLTMSPSGGGTSDGQQTYNPAWDFQYIIREPQVGVPVRLRARLIYKPYQGRDEIAQLYNAWRRELDDAASPD